MAGWILAQVAVTLETSLNLPGWFDTAIVSTLLLGFPVALILAWAFEITPDGVKLALREEDNQDGRPLSLLDILLIVGLSLVAIAVGYQLLSLSRTAPESSLEQAAAQLIPDADTSIAVLPFADLSDTGDQEYFSDGLSEELLNVLAQVEGLKVASRTSSFSFKDRSQNITEIATLLGVAHVLEGSVRKSGDRLRITAQLIRASDGFHMWSETYDRTLDDVFAIQDDISNRILDELRTRIMGDVPEVQVARANVTAFDLVLRAREVGSTYSVPGHVAAAELYRQAIDIDPDYATAYAGLAAVELLNSNARGAQGRRPIAEVAPIVKPLLDKALELDPDSPGVWMRIALYRQFTRDLDGAEAAYKRAKKLQPNTNMTNYAVLLRQQNRLNDALGILERELETNPRSPAVRFGLVSGYVSARRFDEAQKIVDAMYREFPDLKGNFSPDFAQAEVLLAQGQWAEAIKVLEKAFEDSPDVLPIKFQLGFSYIALKDYPSAYAIGEPLLSTYLTGVTGNPEAALNNVLPMLGPGTPAFLYGASMFMAYLNGDYAIIADKIILEWPTLDGLRACDDSEFIFNFAAASYRELGRQNDLDDLMACWSELIEVRRRNGYDSSEEWVERAGYFAFRGDKESAFDALQKASNPALTVTEIEVFLRAMSLDQDPRGRAILNRHYADINRERAKLGLDAVEPPQ